MTDFRRLTVTATLKTPVIHSGGYWTLDGLLAGVIFDQCQDVEVAHSTVPIRCTEGLFHASAAVIEPLRQERIAFVANSDKCFLLAHNLSHPSPAAAPRSPPGTQASPLSWIRVCAQGTNA